MNICSVQNHSIVHKLHVWLSFFFPHLLRNSWKWSRQRKLLKNKWWMLLKSRNDSYWQSLFYNKNTNTVHVSIPFFIIQTHRRGWFLSFNLLKSNSKVLNRGVVGLLGVFCCFPGFLKLKYAGSSCYSLLTKQIHATADFAILWKLFNWTWKLKKVGHDTCSTHSKESGQVMGGWGNLYHIPTAATAGCLSQMYFVQISLIVWASIA